jgi:hypothetical protein
MKYLEGSCYQKMEFVVYLTVLSISSGYVVSNGRMIKRIGKDVNVA